MLSNRPFSYLIAPFDLIQLSDQAISFCTQFLDLAFGAPKLLCENCFIAPFGFFQLSGQASFLCFKFIDPAYDASMLLHKRYILRLEGFDLFLKSLILHISRRVRYSYLILDHLFSTLPQLFKCIRDRLNKPPILDWKEAPYLIK